MSKRSKIAAIDLFCGTGGLSLGLKQGGIQVVAGIDNASSCSYPYSHNIKARFIERSVCDVTGKELNRLWGHSDVRLLAGCAPCQPFSSQRRGADTSHEKSWPLLNEFARLVQETLPDFVTMENVPRVQYSPIFNEYVHVWNMLAMMLLIVSCLVPTMVFRSVVDDWCCWLHCMTILRCLNRR